jgi:hypothetical protein
MTQAKATLLMPVENQVRELDSKLLLACIASRRGFSSVIGPQSQWRVLTDVPFSTSTVTFSNPSNLLSPLERYCRNETN